MNALAEHPEWQTAFEERMSAWWRAIFNHQVLLFGFVMSRAMAAHDAIATHESDGSRPVQYEGGVLNACHRHHLSDVCANP